MSTSTESSYKHNIISIDIVIDNSTTPTDTVSEISTNFDPINSIVDIGELMALISYIFQYEESYRNKNVLIV